MCPLDPREVDWSHEEAGTGLSYRAVVQCQARIKMSSFFYFICIAAKVKMYNIYSITIVDIFRAFEIKIKSV